jgi:hypothetical protein
MSTWYNPEKSLKILHEMPTGKVRCKDYEGISGFINHFFTIPLITFTFTVSVISMIFNPMPAHFINVPVNEKPGEEDIPGGLFVLASRHFRILYSHPLHLLMLPVRTAADTSITVATNAIFYFPPVNSSETLLPAVPSGVHKGRSFQRGGT